jgi:hypothetical protein
MRAIQTMPMYCGRVDSQLKIPSSAKVPPRQPGHIGESWNTVCGKTTRVTGSNYEPKGNPQGVATA